MREVALQVGRASKALEEAFLVLDGQISNKLWGLTGRLLRADRLLRYVHVHFKILSSHNPNEHDDPNVDVHELHALGVSVPGLTLLLEGT